MIQALNAQSMLHLRGVSPQGVTERTWSVSPTCLPSATGGNSCPAGLPMALALVKMTASNRLELGHSEMLI